MRQRVGQLHSPMRVRFDESMMEDFIKRYPASFLGEELKFVSQQRRLSAFRTDLVFEDANGALLITELQVEALDRAHFYRTLEYRDLLLEENNHRRVRVMLVCNSIPERFMKLLKIHGVESRVIGKTEFKRKVRQLEPGTVVTTKPPKPRMPLTSTSLLYEIEGRPKGKVGNSDLMGFWLRTTADSGRESNAFHSPLSRRKVVFTSLDSKPYLASGLVELGEIPPPRNEVLVPKQLFVPAKPFQQTVKREQVLRAKKWLELFQRFGGRCDAEVVCGWELPVDFLRYQECQKPHAWQFGFLDDYRRDNGYDEAAIAKDLDWLASLKIFSGVYPNLIPRSPWAAYSFKRGAGSLYEKYVGLAERYNGRRPDSEVLGEFEWLTVKFSGIDRTYLWIMTELLKLRLLNCGKTLRLAMPCPLCLISPRALDKVDERTLAKAARYFAYLPEQSSS
jgi:hypothetical protein